jgi:8-amino-3,8-dideoxy-alpha-D-manno-octulosonate transaminase
MDPIMAIARKRGLKVIEDCAQSVGASYKGKRLGSIGDLGTYSHQLTKTITAGEGGVVVTSDPALFERAIRFHDVGNMMRLHQDWLGQTRQTPFVGTNFRMSEFTGGVMLAQLRKLDRIIASARANAALVYEGLRDLPGVRFRKRPDPDGELGSVVFLGFASKEQREKYVEAMKAENVPAGPPGGSVILPIVPYIENKIATHPAWPTWTSPRGRAIRYGAESCPRTIDVLGRFAGVGIGPKYTRRDIDDIVAAIRKVYPAVVKA